MFCCLAKEKEAVIAPAILNAIKNQLEPDHAQLLNPLQQRNRTAFFVGAGASVESGLPNFRQFSEHLMASTLQQQHTSTSKESNGNIEVPVSDEDISMFASELRPEVLLQTLHDAFGYSIFDFYEWFDDAEPSTNHYILAKALREGGLILTTNVDTLIEEAYEELYGNQDFDLLVTSDEFEKYASSDLASIGSTNTNRNDSKGLLMKFHGTVDKSLTGLERYDTVREYYNYFFRIGYWICISVTNAYRTICCFPYYVYTCTHLIVKKVFCWIKLEKGAAKECTRY